VPDEVAYLLGRGLLALAAAAALTGASVKIAGALLYGSKSLLADALTCIASLAALGVSTGFYLKSLEPPDEDHPYGHERLALAGAALTTIIYASVAGYMLGELLHTGPYRVSIRAPIAAVIGAALYTVSVLASRRLGSAFMGYSTLGWSEILESLIVIATSYLGAELSYIIDYAGAWAILAFVSVEVTLNASHLIKAYSDIAAPEEVYERTREVLEAAGFRLVSARIRLKAPGVYHGDAVVACPADATVLDVHERLEEAVRALRRESIDLVVTIKPCPRERGAE
jgi:cobalt-zinc-cadmium efflux system protein